MRVRKYYISSIGGVVLESERVMEGEGCETRKGDT